MKRANNWTRDKLESWGLENAHLEAWGKFGRGWSLKRFSAQVVEPQCIPLIAYPKAWSPGTGGPLVAPVVLLDAKNEADLAKYKGKLKGAIVLTAPQRDLAARFEPLARGSPMAICSSWPTRPNPPAVASAVRRRRPRRRTATAARPDAWPSTAERQPERLRHLRRRPSPGRASRRSRVRDRGKAVKRSFTRGKLRFLIEEGPPCWPIPACKVTAARSSSHPRPSRSPNPTATQGRGQGPGGNRTSIWDKDAPATIPQMVIATEHYNRLVRMLDQGESLKMEVDLAVEFHDDDLMAYNTVAEIPGTDLKDELVMLGGHMDSWHSGTGATDNAAGVSVAMEAVRILKALDLKPRRTIRIALWTGEEQGLLGSRGYVSEHFQKSRPAAADARRPRRRPAGGEGEPRPRSRNRSRRPTRPPSPITRSSRPTSTSTTAPARSAASTSRATRPCGRSSASGSSRSARWARPP